MKLEKLQFRNLHPSISFSLPPYMEENKFDILIFVPHLLSNVLSPILKQINVSVQSTKRLIKSCLVYPPGADHDALNLLGSRHNTAFPQQLYHLG